jgi:hypothetical protein
VLCLTSRVRRSSAAAEPERVIAVRLRGG